MSELEAIIERIRVGFEQKNSAREQALARSRELIRNCSLVIRAAHRGEYDLAATLLQTARMSAEQMQSDLAAHSDLYYTGYSQDALKEYAEASIVFALITDRDIPPPEDLGIPSGAWLNGLGEAVGELRRYVLDIVRRGDLEHCERMLQVMEDVYSVLVTIDYPDTITGGLRRTTDMVRGVLERTRGDLTLAVRQDAMQRALSDFETRLLGDAGRK